MKIEIEDRLVSAIFRKAIFSTKYQALINKAIRKQVQVAFDDIYRLGYEDAIKGKEKKE